MKKKEKEKDYTTILLEQIRDQNKAILEGQKDQATRADISELRQDVAQLKSDVAVIKAVVKATNHDLTEHKRLSADEAHGPGHVNQTSWAAA